MRYRLLLLLFVLVFFLIAHRSASQPAEYKTTEKEYIERFKDDAVKDMLIYGIPASITLAQAMVESENGNSSLAVYANNHFGIKCHNEWAGETYHKDDDAKDECFRKYPSAYDSYADHSSFLKTRKRYAFLFELKQTDYKGWAKGLRAAGYATDPAYSAKLIGMIERHKLNQYDTLESIPAISSRPVISKSQVKQNMNHDIIFFNNIKCIILKQGDNLQNIADELDIEIWQLLKYNNLSKSEKLLAGHKLYLQPKRRKSNGIEFHMVKQGDTMKVISQLYGVKLKHLYSKNQMRPGEEPKVGEKIYLKGKKKEGHSR